jgi:hypothetical protein
MSYNKATIAVLENLKKRNNKFNALIFMKDPCASKYIIQLSRENALLFQCKPKKTPPKKRKSVKRK